MISAKNEPRLPHTAPESWIVPRRVMHLKGKRGSALADIQLVCGAGPYELDILVREQAGPTSLEIVGQVTLSGRIYEPVADLPLALVEAPADQRVSDTRTDDFGEFDLVSSRQGVLGLRLGEGPDAPCVLVWEGGAS